MAHDMALTFCPLKKCGADLRLVPETLFEEFKFRYCSQCRKTVFWCCVCKSSFGVEGNRTARLQEHRLRLSHKNRQAFQFAGHFVDESTLQGAAGLLALGSTDSAPPPEEPKPAPPPAWGGAKKPAVEKAPAPPASLPMPEPKKPLYPSAEPRQSMFGYTMPFVAPAPPVQRESGARGGVGAGASASAAGMPVSSMAMMVAGASGVASVQDAQRSLVAGVEVRCTQCGVPVPREGSVALPQPRPVLEFQRHACPCGRVFHVCPCGAVLKKVAPSDIHHHCQSFRHKEAGVPSLRQGWSEGTRSQLLEIASHMETWEPPPEAQHKISDMVAQIWRMTAGQRQSNLNANAAAAAGSSNAAGSAGASAGNGVGNGASGGNSSGQGSANGINCISSIRSISSTSSGPATNASSNTSSAATTSASALTTNLRSNLNGPATVTATAVVTASNSLSGTSSQARAGAAPATSAANAVKLEPAGPSAAAVVALAVTVPDKGEAEAERPAKVQKTAIDNLVRDAAKGSDGAAKAKPASAGAAVKKES